MYATSRMGLQSVPYWRHMLWMANALSGPLSEPFAIFTETTTLRHGDFQKVYLTTVRRGRGKVKFHEHRLGYPRPGIIPLNPTGGDQTTITFIFKM